MVVFAAFGHSWWPNVAGNPSRREPFAEIRHVAGHMSWQRSRRWHFLPPSLFMSCSSMQPTWGDGLRVSADRASHPREWLAVTSTSLCRDHYSKILYVARREVLIFDRDLILINTLSKSSSKIWCDIQLNTNNISYHYNMSFNSV